ncbi:MAG: hypothetical protein AAGA70_19470 [Pseudomonadota bacterium]
MNLQTPSFLLSCCLALAPCAAIADGVRITGAASGMPIENDFARNLPGTLLRAASLSLTEPARLTFTPVAAESGNHNVLTVSGLGSLAEDRDFGFRRGTRDQISGVFAPGALDQILIFTSDFGDRAIPGTDSFGVFVDGAAGEEFTSFFLVYDDTTGTDGDYDDYIIRVDVEPVE